jgi:hypothetical protein
VNSVVDNLFNFYAVKSSLSDAVLNEENPLTDRVLINLLTDCPHRRMLRGVELYRSNYSQFVASSLLHLWNEFYAVLPSFSEVKSNEEK